MAKLLKIKRHYNLDENEKTIEKWYDLKLNRKEETTINRIKYRSRNIDARLLLIA